MYLKYTDTWFIKLRHFIFIMHLHHSNKVDFCDTLRIELYESLYVYQVKYIYFICNARCKFVLLLELV